MYLAEVFDELGSGKFVGIVRVGGVEFALIVGNGFKTLGVLPVFESFVG